MGAHKEPKRLETPRYVSFISSSQSVCTIIAHTQAVQYKNNHSLMFRNMK